MSDSKVSVDDLDKAIGERLDLYKSNVADRILKLTKSSMRKLVKLTRERAPKNTSALTGGKRKPGTFARHITSTVEDKGVLGAIGTWGLSGKEYRLTHLLVHGHQTRSGGRTEPNDFLSSALQEVEDEYLKGIEKAVKEE